MVFGKAFGRLFIMGILFVMCLPCLLGATSEDNFYSIGSDFLVIQNPQSTSIFPPTVAPIIDTPKFYSLYDNTKISFDINNDGAYDYEYTVNKGGPYTFSPSWSIKEGTKIHSNKPIACAQIFYHYEFRNQWGGPTKIIKSSIIPPISNFRNQYLLGAGAWNFLTDEANQTIFIDENIDGTIDKTIIVSRNSSNISLTNIAKAYSSKNFFAYSNDALSGVVSNDFIAGKNNIFVIIPEDGTNLIIDYNCDTIPDYSVSLNKGNYKFNVTYGSRIKADKDISVFDYFLGELRIGYPEIFIPSAKFDSVSNEFLVASGGSGETLVSVFNYYSANNINFGLSLYYNLSTNPQNFQNLSNGNLTPIANVGAYYANSSAPMTGFYEYNYYSGNEYKYYTGKDVAYKSVYMTTTPKSKFVTRDSTSTINLRVFNPFKDLIVSGISIKFPVNNFFSMPLATVNGRQESLITGASSPFSKTVTLMEDDGQTYFIFDYDDALGPESFLDLDFDLTTPGTEGLNEFLPATLTYTAPTWKDS